MRELIQVIVSVQFQGICFVNACTAIEAVMNLSLLRMYE